VILYTNNRSAQASVFDKTVMLVNENTMSQAEHTGLFFQEKAGRCCVL
jgi:hypothetical protein